jgi:hypothetical protein
VHIDCTFTRFAEEGIPPFLGSCWVTSTLRKDSGEHPPEVASLEVDAAAATIVLAAPVDAPDEAFALEVEALEQMESEAALANLETEEALALSEECFLGLDSP